MQYQSLSLFKNGLEHGVIRQLGKTEQLSKLYNELLKQEFLISHNINLNYFYSLNNRRRKKLMKSLIEREFYNEK